MPVAAFFDLDKTLLDTSVSFAYIRPIFAAGLISRRSVLRTVRHRLGYKLLGAGQDRLNRIRDEGTAMVRGWSEDVVTALADKHAADIVARHLYPGARDLIEEHRAAGHTLVIASASPYPLVAAVANQLDVELVVATRFGAVDGVYDGTLELYVDGAAKAAALTELATRNGYDLAGSHAYTDSVNDLPTLRMVGHPVAVNPDRGLRRAALAAGWPIRRFTH